MKIKVYEDVVETTGKIRLHYVSRGEGLAIIFCNGIGVSAANFWSGLCTPLSQYYRTINWDYQGHGSSDPPIRPEHMTIRSCADDLCHLMDNLEIEKAVIVGHSMGVQVAFEFFRNYRERVLGLIPVLGTYKHPLDTAFQRIPYVPEGFQQIRKAATSFPSTLDAVWPMLFDPRLGKKFARAVGLVHPTKLADWELDIYLGHLQSISYEMILHLANDMQEHSVEDLLEHVDVPTLIFAGEKDLFTPPEVSLFMHRRIPHSRFVLVEDGTHTAHAEQPELFMLHAFKFMTDFFPGTARPFQSPFTASV